MTANTNNNEETVVADRELKDLLEGIGERNRKEWEAIAVAYRDIGGDYEDFKNHFLRMSIKRFERAAERYWEQDYPNSGLATLQHCQGGRCDINQ